MNIAEIAMIAAGVLTLALAIFHLRFPRLFGWGADFVKLTATNHKLLYTIHAALTLLLLIIGIITLVFAVELATGVGLAGGIGVSLALFWLWRLIWQLAVFRRPSRRALHGVLIAVFAVLAVAYALPVVYS